MMVMMWSRMEEILVKRFSGSEIEIPSQLPVATPGSKSLGKRPIEVRAQKTLLKF